MTKRKHNKKKQFVLRLITKAEPLLKAENPRWLTAAV